MENVETILIINLSNGLQIIHILIIELLLVMPFEIKLCI